MPSRSRFSITFPGTVFSFQPPGTTTETVSWVLEEITPTGLWARQRCLVEIISRDHHLSLISGQLTGCCLRSGGNTRLFVAASVWSWLTDLSAELLLLLCSSLSSVQQKLWLLHLPLTVTFCYSNWTFYNNNKKKILSASVWFRYFPRTVFPINVAVLALDPAEFALLRGK